MLFWVFTFLWILVNLDIYFLSYKKGFKCELVFIIKLIFIFLIFCINIFVVFIGLLVGLEICYRIKFLVIKKF